MGGASSTMTDGAGAMDGSGMASDLGSAGEFDASKSMVAGPDAYGSGYEMGSAQRVPDFYDDNGQPVYIAELAKEGNGRGRELLKKILQNVGNSGGASAGAMGGGASGGGGQVYSGAGNGIQFHVDRPWTIPNNEHPEQVNQATYKAIMTAVKMAAGGM